MTYTQDCSRHRLCVQPQALLCGSIDTGQWLRGVLRMLGRVLHDARQHESAVWDGTGGHGHLPPLPDRCQPFYRYSIPANAGTFPEPVVAFLPIVTVHAAFQ